MKMYKVFMKIILNIILVIALISTLSNCSTEGEAELTIVNNSSIKLEEVYWRNTSFGDILTGMQVTKAVSGIDTPVFVRFKKAGIEYFTEEEIKVEPGTHITFVFTDNTKVNYYK